MAPVLEVETLAETASAVAFSIGVKSPEGAGARPPVRARLEARREEELPRLLRSSRDAKPATPPTSPVKELADRARAQNERRLAAVQKLRLSFEELCQSKRSAQEKATAQAQEIRSAALATVQSKARKTWETFLEKAERRRGQRAEDAAAEAQRRVERAERQRLAAVELRRRRAGREVQQAREKAAACLRRRSAAASELRARLDQAMQRASDYRTALIQQRRAAAGGRFTAATLRGREALRCRGEASERQLNVASERSRLAGQRRASLAAARRGQAGGHFQEAVARGRSQLQQAQATGQEQLRRLAGAQSQRAAARALKVFERAAKASGHNALVSKKVQEHAEAQQARIDVLRQRLREKAQRKACRWNRRA